MTEAMTTDKVVHFEIPFDDSERAFKFYRDIFGWKISKAGGRTMTPARKVGGMGIYACVEDTEGNVIGLWKPLRN